ncbi:MAG: endopeptidase La [Candidatus Cloacimonadota bacterium]|nr:MAG: endopeptidase La [Candidatus Cloacimonadota bacterium]PIE78798.1 MAG: endopeptidase La [Candidatus Delongbacteria bacterium]
MSNKNIKIPNEIPIVPLANMVVFPNIIIPLVITNENLIKLIDDSLTKDRIVGIFSNRQDGDDGYNYSEIYSVGTAAVILKMFKSDDNESAKLLIQGLTRIQLEEIITEEPYLLGKVSQINEVPSKGLEFDAIRRKVSDLFAEVIDLSTSLPEDLKVVSSGIKNPSKLFDLVASNLNIDLAVRQEILEEFDVEERSKILIKALNKEIKLLKLSSKIQEEVNDELEKDQREYYLREQMRAIKRELGDQDDESHELEELEEKIFSLKLPKEVLEAATRELKRLNRMPSASSEYTVARTYLDWIVDIPWNNFDKTDIDINYARRVLDKDHFGLKDVKERILEYLAVRKLKSDTKGSILCLSGPPGVGKTSMGKSIARAMKRKFVKASLGGVRDEAEIRGHRRTYIGSMPGIIIKQIKKSGVANPVILLDEIDKLGQSHQGDPASALLEVLDPQQNNIFVDHYLDLPFDLSKVVFIMTANYLQNIPAPLLDRMEILDLPSYLLTEKVEIAKNYLIPRQIEENGLEKKSIKFTKKAIEFIAQNYTREAGVRKLEQKIEKVCRKIAIKKALGEDFDPKIDVDRVKELLGNRYITPEMANRKNEIGISTGLAWSPSGGSVLFIESTLMGGKGQIKVTGSLGKVMKESVEIAISYLRSKMKDYGISEETFSKNDIHIHFPDGATPKDGPSAGIAIATSLISLFRNIPIRKDVAMTGELSLRGKVMEIGGLREKMIAAQKAGIKTVIIPENNVKDLEDIPEIVKISLNIKPLSHVEEVFDIALSKKL